MEIEGHGPDTATMGQGNVAGSYFFPLPENRDEVYFPEMGLQHLRLLPKDLKLCLASGV